MNRKELLNKIKDAGVVGAGGAGFPTHVKLDNKAEFVIANGAECEPLLRVDRTMMELYPERIVKGLGIAIEITGAKKGFICLKKKYVKAIEALEKAIASNKKIEIFKMENYYPAGDEQQMVFDVTGRVVPTGGLPIDAGAVVSNVSTLINIAAAAEDKPVTSKYVTVTGEVKEPAIYNVPIGTPVSLLIQAAGGPTENRADYRLIIGGPLMGFIENNWDASVTKTTGGVILLPADHKLVRAKENSLEREYRMAKAVCCQCSYCTQMCPRNALGLGVEPHKAMRSLAYRTGDPLLNSNGIFSCCNCGICSYYACNMGLNPSKVMTAIKNSMMKNGIKPRKEVASAPNPSREYMKVSAHRLIEKMGLDKYDIEVPLKSDGPAVKKVKIGLKQHVGAPAEPLVNAGDSVKTGDIIASVKPDKLGSYIHASIDGVITDITRDYIEITQSQQGGKV